MDTVYSNYNYSKLTDVKETLILFQLVAKNTSNFHLKLN